VRFFASPTEAEAAGLRACLRCRPNEVGRDEQAVLGAIATIRESGDAPLLEDLARAAGYSLSHFQRLLTRMTGLSPAAYARALRRERAEAALAAGERVTQAIYRAGYGAPSRFYEASRERTGMTASAWRNGGRGATIHWAQVKTSLGVMLLAATEKGVCRLSFGEGPEALRVRFPNAEIVAGGEDFARLCARVVETVESPGEPWSIPLDVRGTAFQEAVWEQLRAIPPGETRSYGEIAALLGKPGASRAVGQANGANPVSVLTPCHRVVAADGSLGGYAWGEPIKRELLRREAET
jgi:AraC family transcriptional regulator of adaptative response/methylated-DNA-[protein]-cysteine methyltransferase